MASMYKWDGVAQASALRCLDFNLMAPETLAGLQGISMDDYARLLSLAHRRQLRFIELLNDPGVFPAADPELTCRHCKIPVKDVAWSALQAEFGAAIYVCSSGTAIKRVIDRSEIWRSFVGLFHCRGGPLFDAENTYKTIFTALNSLPTNLNPE